MSGEIASEDEHVNVTLKFVILLTLKGLHCAMDLFILLGVENGIY